MSDDKKELLDGDAALMADTNRFVWVDLETTGTNPEKDLILEMAMVITDGQLHEIVRTTEVIWHPMKGNFVEMLHPKVAEMHMSSGLLRALLDARRDVRDVERIMFNLVQNYCNLGEARLAGSTIGFDRAFLKKNMPMFEGYLHYRSFDVSTLREAGYFWRPDLFQSKGTPVHRAMADIEESIATAKRYREFFLAAPKETA